MPDQHGRLTPLEQSAIESWLGSRWHERICPICKCTDWVAGNHILMDQAYPGESASQSRRMTVVPYVVRFCENCAYAIRFNWAMIQDMQGPPETGAEPLGTPPSGVNTNG